MYCCTCCCKSIKKRHEKAERKAKEKELDQKEIELDKKLKKMDEKINEIDSDKGQTARKLVPVGQAPDQKEQSESEEIRKLRK